MKFGKLFGWGIVIYALMYLMWSGFITYGFVEGIWPRLIGLIALVCISLCAGLSLRLSSWKDILPYSFGWAIVLAGMDAVFSVPFSGWAIFLDYNLWFGYAIVAVVPLMTGRFCVACKALGIPCPAHS
jgi:hypothetical protein